MTRSLARSLVASLILFPSLAAAQSGSGANAGYRSGAALGNPLATSGGFPSFEHPAAADSSFPASANALPSLGLPSGAPLLPAQADAIDRMRGTPPLEAPLDPESYRVDKGDVLTARFWGEQNFELSLPVDPDGRLFVPRLGYVQAHGRTLAAVAGEVHKLLQSRFPRLHLAVTLSQPRTFLVRVTGAVGSPGAAVAANGWTRASDAIRRAGGVLPGGSSRAIELHRADGTSQT